MDMNPDPFASDSDNSTRPLRLLSLDGGGIRGYSELKILQTLMRLIQLDGNLQRTPLPCEYFDLIGGTSTGGIIAVLLGRLRLSVDKCMEIYASLSQDVFGKQRFGWGLWQTRFDHNILESVVKGQLRELDLQSAAAIDNRAGESVAIASPGPGVSRATEDPAEIMMYDNHPKACKAFVTATPGSNAQKGDPYLFRTYISREQRGGEDCKVWQAIRATSAAPTFFDHIVINGSDYVDGGVGCNNPVNFVYEEARRLWPERDVGCIVSLGTGMPRVLSLQNPTFRDSRIPKDYIQVLERTATECDTAHQEMLRKRELKGKYFRFNVQQGLQGVSLMEWEKLGETASLTEAYLREVEIERKMNELVTKVVALDGWIEEPLGAVRGAHPPAGNDWDLPRYASRSNTRNE